MQAKIIALGRSFSIFGLVVGTVFFAASLSPSLMPRTYLVQGIVAGFCAALGYGVGVLMRWLWLYLELPLPRTRTTVKIAAIGICVAIAAIVLWRATEWQNSIRKLMGLDPVQSAEPLELVVIALAVFGLLVLFARLFRLTCMVLAALFERFLPRRVSVLVGGLIAVGLFWSIAEGLLFRTALRIADTSFQQLDAMIDDDLAMPGDPVKTGSAASLIDWKELGRRGREFIISGPTGAEIGNFFHENALDPIRVYVGLNSADTAEERARLALAELKRNGAFKRSILIVIVPTGTGWVDPAAVDTVEFLHKGDVASVALQYSYLSSWLSLLVEPAYGAEAGRALFREVYRYWVTLPRDQRPKLYLHGLSLGAMNSELSADLFDIVADPFQGALWSGPPFQSRTWKSVTANRNPGSPAWLPRFRDGSIIRFTNQHDALNIPGSVWGPIRIVYLQYASDPVTFFDFHSLYREPDWMKMPRGPDVSPELRWFPLVTMTQLLLDMATATTSPIGYGHVYAPEHYIDAWIAVTDPQGLSPNDVGRLKTFFENKFRSGAEPAAHG
ncbi:alpha/beta hydrolase [Rhizobium viscosum]|uniref:Membrane protein n=1 Tax=Rhizobium viscosum TaxID=1673 RepID=A0ABR9IQN6_RHIVS|nr:alpha/beta-hydrolase family protein [Rhizobium viscosum]MBE1505506.1 putative membrane protein [Rhizobium viscosum]